ncbi:hypothetical protein GXW74_19660 [Roseomonas eburnea]|uniref:Uncharacterized protein n=1 Tax=Neoroseomonas eburnea TaxID=1346889 RepID=A0A9X9XG82_9PROT|nr:hypothetical protein [Neoroseomonas eburnea]MBR0682718.1 hypothetical protein [Neoroseomonas eburnea]
MRWPEPRLRAMLCAVLRVLFLLVALAALGFGGWWLATAPPPAPPAPVPPASAAERLVRPSSATPPAAGASGLHTPLGDAMFRWRCTAGLREVLGERSDWPLRRVATLCLCVAERMREEGLRDFVLSGGDTAAGLAAAEASLCRR